MFFQDFLDFGALCMRAISRGEQRATIRAMPTSFAESNPLHKKVTSLNKEEVYPCPGLSQGKVTRLCTSMERAFPMYKKGSIIIIPPQAGARVSNGNIRAQIIHTSFVNR